MMEKNIFGKLVAFFLSLIVIGFFIGYSFTVLTSTHSGTSSLSAINNNSKPK